MKLRIWHILTLWGLALLLGTVGAADMGAIGTGRIVAQIIGGIGLIVLAYVAFITACGRCYKQRWAKYERR